MRMLAKIDGGVHPARCSSLVHPASGCRRRRRLGCRTRRDQAKDARLGAIGCHRRLLLAIFWAFHDLRTERDKRIAELELEVDAQLEGVQSETEAQKKERLLKAAHDNLTELDSAHSEVERALEKGKFWRGYHLSADRIREFETAPGAVKQSELYRMAAAVHVWIDGINKRRHRTRGGRDERGWASAGT